MASRTTAECAVRKIVVAISSAAVSSAFATRRTAIGASWASATAGSTSTAVRTSAPVAASSATVQPGGTTTVVSYSSISSGPLTGSARCARLRTGTSIVPYRGPKSARRVAATSGCS